MNLFIVCATVFDKFLKYYMKMLLRDFNAKVGRENNMLNRWKNYFSQLLNVHRASGVRQIEIYIAEPLIPDPSRF
jgi:hypothetical protein